MRAQTKNIKLTLPFDHTGQPGIGIQKDVFRRQYHGVDAREDGQQRTGRSEMECEDGEGGMRWGQFLAALLSKERNDERKNFIAYL